MPTPLRSATSTEQGPQTPEALLISALLESGEFDLSRWRIDRADFDCYQPLVRFCAEHQEHTGRAPAIELVARKYPDFELTTKVDPLWAAGELRKAVAHRGLRTRIHEALTLLEEEDVEEAYSRFDDLQPPHGTRRDPLDGFDFSGVEESFDAGYIEVPYPTLGRATGGIKEAELWYLAARTGTGKTNIASAYAARAVAQGNRVAVWSLEIPANAYLHRIRRVLAANSSVPGLLKMFDSEDRDEVKKALDILREKYNLGSFVGYDPSHGRCTVEAVRHAMEDADLVIVDHVGLMVTRDGKRAIDDWRVMATISNRLKEETLRTRIPVLGVAQINRAGESTSTLRTPKLSELSQADALGQDGDVVVTMNRYSTHALLHDGAKIRNGPGVKWFSQFDPAKALYTEIKRERADALQALDLDDEARMLGDD